MSKRTATISTTSSKLYFHNTKMRMELFFKTTQELKDRIAFFQKHNMNSYNLVNKHSSDTLQEWSDTILQQQPNATVTIHYSLRYQKVKRGTVQQHYDKFKSFLQSLQQQNTKQQQQQVQVLLVSGSSNNNNNNNNSTSTSNNSSSSSSSTNQNSWDTVTVLQKLQQDNDITAAFDDSHLCSIIGVAYSPYLDPIAQRVERDHERTRLEQKLQTGLVSAVYLQFGTDLAPLSDALNFLTTIITTSSSCRRRHPQRKQQQQQQQHNNQNITVIASIFLPTAQLLAQQKFRPWKGVFLSDDFLSSPQQARKIVVDMLRLLQEYNDVELLWEAPGVRTEKDWNLIESLLRERDNDNSDNNKDRSSSSSPSSFKNAAGKKNGSTKDGCIENDSTSNANNNSSKRQKTTDGSR